MDKQVGSDEGQPRRAARERAFRRYAHINKQLLTELYYEQRLSTVDIARQLGVCRNVIWEYMEMYGLERRSAGHAGALKSRCHHLDEAFFARINAEDDDKAYIVGFILGDGTLIDRRCSKRLQIGIADDDGDLLEQMAVRLGDATLVRRNIQPRTPAERPKALLRIDSTRLVDDLIALGLPLGKKSGNEPFLIFPTDRLAWNFLRGVFDADGHIRVYERSGMVNGTLYGPYQRARWSITCGVPFVSGLRDFLLARGFELSAKCIQPKQGTGLIEIADQHTIRRIGAAMYQYGSLWLLRKKHIFDMLV
jgi:hypothetical protein